MRQGLCILFHLLIADKEINSKHRACDPVLLCSDHHTKLYLVGKAYYWVGHNHAGQSECVFKIREDTGASYPLGIGDNF